MAVHTYEHAALILNADPRQKLYFQLMPDSLNVSKSAEWASTEVLGRSEPYRSYRSSSPRAISFTMRFFASVDQGDSGDPWDDVKRKADWLEALVYPDADTGYPPLVNFLFGNTFSTRCLVRSVSIKFEGPWQFERQVGDGDTQDTVLDILPMQAEASLALDEVNATPRLAVDVREAKYQELGTRFGGSTATSADFKNKSFTDQLFDLNNPLKLK